MADERLDSMFLTLAQQSHGIEPLLDNLFSFLRRKTDFFSGASQEQIEELVLKVARKQSAIYQKDEAEKRKQKEKEELLKKKKAEEKKKKEEEEKAKEQAKQQAKSVEDVLELSEDGTFDTANVNVKDVSEEPPKSVFTKTQEITSQEDNDVKDAAKADGEEEDDKTPPPPGNGGRTDKYVWTQTLSELTITVPVPPGTKSKMLDVDISNKKLKVGLKGQPHIVNGELHKRVVVDDSLWTLDGNELSINLQKDNKMEWWKCVIIGDPEINTQKVQPENSKLSDLDGETRQTVEKMMFDQRQKALGLPTADELQKQEMLKKFMAAHPEMDFSKAKFS